MRAMSLYSMTLLLTCSPDEPKEFNAGPPSSLSLGSDAFFLKGPVKLSVPIDKIGIEKGRKFGWCTLLASHVGQSHYAMVEAETARAYRPHGSE